MRFPLRPTCHLCLIVFAVGLAACAAPISYRQTPVEIPSGDFTKAPLSDALRSLKAGRSTKDHLPAAAHFFDCAWQARVKALQGEPGAVELYNYAVARLFERVQLAGELPWGRSVTLGTADAPRRLTGRLETKAPAADRRFVMADGLTFRGRLAAARAVRPGVGAPLVAIIGDNRDYRSSFEAPQSYSALTAVLHFDDARSATLKLHDPLEAERIRISGRNPVLAADFTAPAALALAQTRLDRLGLQRLLHPRRFSNTARLIRLQRYDPKRIPVLMVHGLQDTEATWALMYQNLMADPVIRDRYQFWVFSYPSGNPYPFSASLMRRELDGVRRAFPDHQDLVLVGHSMGGIISRLMVTNAGDTIWRSMFGRGPEEIQVGGASRQLLLDSVVFNHQEQVDRVVFIATPHRGSILASNWIGRMGSRLVRLPTYITDVRNDFASLLTADASALRLNLAPNSIDTLSPNNGFVRQVNKMPIAAGVPYHSIIGDRGRGDTPDSSDGVVAYWSSHLEGATSEKIVPSNHSAHMHPEAIEEVNRILKLHLHERR